MEQINEFFEELELLFLKIDKEAFKEIKEDIIHEIEERLAEGENYEEILNHLGSPKDISEAFYEDKRLDKAMKAPQDVIDRNELIQEYKLKRKEILDEKKRKTWLISFTIIRGILGTLGTLLIVTIIFYLLQEHTILWGPITMLLAIISVFLLLSKNKFKKTYQFWTIGVIGSLGLIGSLVLLTVNSWFYLGHFSKRSVPLKIESLSQIKINNNNSVDINIIHVPKGANPKVEIIGYLTKKDKKNLFNSTKNSTELIIGQKSWINWINKLKSTKIIFHIPEGTKQRKLNFHVKKGNINLNHINIEKIFFNIDKGKIELTDVKSKQLTVESKKADLIIRHFFSNITVNNTNGKSIISDGQGNIQAASTSGLINVSGVKGKKVSMDNKKGKNIVSTGALQQLNIQNKEGTTIIDNQKGKTKIKNGSGKVILNDLKDYLILLNMTGTIIMNEQYPIKGKIQSDTGDIKWLQASGTNQSFILNSTSGKIHNTFNENKQANRQVRIQTNTGDIKIISSR